MPGNRRTGRFPEGFGSAKQAGRPLEVVRLGGDSGETTQTPLDAQLVAVFPSQAETFDQQRLSLGVVTARSGDLRQIRQDKAGAIGVAMLAKFVQRFREILRGPVDLSLLVGDKAEEIEGKRRP